MLCLSSLVFLTGMFALQTVGDLLRPRRARQRQLLHRHHPRADGRRPSSPRRSSRSSSARSARSRPTSPSARSPSSAASRSPLAPASTPVIAFGCFFVLGIGLGGVNTLMWALEADTVEYGEWKTGVRTEGTTYALFSFTRKMGQAIGGAAAAYTIGFGGYVAQSADPARLRDHRHQDRGRRRAGRRHRHRARDHVRLPADREPVPRDRRARWPSAASRARSRPPAPRGPIPATTTGGTHMTAGPHDDARRDAVRVVRVGGELHRPAGGAGAGRAVPRAGVLLGGDRASAMTERESEGLLSQVFSAMGGVLRRPRGPVRRDGPAGQLRARHGEHAHGHGGGARGRRHHGAQRRVDPRGLAGGAPRPAGRPAPAADPTRRQGERDRRRPGCQAPEAGGPGARRHVDRALRMGSPGGDALRPHGQHGDAWTSTRASRSSSRPPGSRPGSAARRPSSGPRAQPTTDGRTGGGRYIARVLLQQAVREVAG